MSDLFTGILFICKLTHNLIRRRIAEPCILSLYIHPCRCIRRMLACDACILASASEAEPSQSVAYPCERTLTHSERRRSAELCGQASGTILSHVAQSIGRVVRTSRLAPKGEWGRGASLHTMSGLRRWGKLVGKSETQTEATPHYTHTITHTFDFSSL